MHTRAPGSIEQALDKLAGEPLLGGWTNLAAIVGRAENTVRNWANPTTDESIPLALALRLDLAWQRAGLLGAPIRDAYNALADQQREGEFGCQIELTRGTAVFARENGQAEEALLMASLPGAGEAEIAAAERELSDVTALASDLAGKLRRLRRSSRAPP